MTRGAVGQKYEQDVIAILSELTADWDDLGTNGAIGPDTSIVADLGFESLDVVYMVTAIEDRYGRRDLPFEQLLMVDGAYVADLTVRQIASFLSESLEGAGN
jgi:acyl carrier protein